MKNMRKKKFFVPLLIGFMMIFLVSSGVPVQAQTTNVWGLEEGDTYTYTYTYKYSGTGSGEGKSVYNYEIQRVEDWNNNNITDMAFTVEEIEEGGATWISRGMVMGSNNFDEVNLVEDIDSFTGIPDVFLPVDWVEATPSQLVDGGLNWTAAIEAINTAVVSPLVDYNATVDDDKVTVETATDRPHLYINGTEAAVGADYDVEQKTVWDKEKGILEEYSWTKTYNESLGLVIEKTVEKGGPGIMDTISDNAIAIAGLALAVLALLLIILKR